MEQCQLEKLKVVISDNGEKVREIELEDPRERFIKQFNQDWEELGLSASLN